MIVCPQCHHQNPDTLNRCEACCSELPAGSSCPNCGHKYRVGSKFCGHCGENLMLLGWEADLIASGKRKNKLPELSPPEPIVEVGSIGGHLAHSAEFDSGNQSQVTHDSAGIGRSETLRSDLRKPNRAVLVHQPTQFKIQLGKFESPIHLGKPNRKVMPDINIATFKHSEIVSRIHADILVEDDQFYIQDKGSANGTFVNDQRIRPEHRQRLASGDKISLGKGNLVTFTFELS